MSTVPQIQTVILSSLIVSGGLEPELIYRLCFVKGRYSMSDNGYACAGRNLNAQGGDLDDVMAYEHVHIRAPSQTL